MKTKQFFLLIATACCVYTKSQIDPHEDTSGVIKNPGVINDMRTPDTSKAAIIQIKSVANPVNVVAPVKSDAKPQTNPVLNGYYVLYNKNKQKTKDGTFVDNRLKDGKNYIYDNKGVLVRVELYRDFKYVGDTTEK